MAKRHAHGSDGVRIIGGEWRGRRIHISEHSSVRPTPDRVRETLFNWLAGILPGLRCLDLFAGTGVLGFEALSRGAEKAWFVERDPALVKVLEEQVASLAADARVVQGNALEVLGDPPSKLFDVVFVDPPYVMDLAEVLHKLPVWVTHENLIYVERPTQRGGNPLADVVALVPGAKVIKQGRAARVTYGLLRLEK